MVSTQVSMNGYHVSVEIYNGSRTLVYRAYRETDRLFTTKEVGKGTGLGLTLARQRKRHLTHSL